MLTLKNTSVMNFENAIRGARNPMNSWGRMDSKIRYTIARKQNIPQSWIRQEGKQTP